MLHCVYVIPGNYSTKARVSVFLHLWKLYQVLQESGGKAEAAFPGWEEECVKDKHFALLSDFYITETI